MKFEVRTELSQGIRQLPCHVDFRIWNLVYLGSVIKDLLVNWCHRYKWLLYNNMTHVACLMLAYVIMDKMCFAIIGIIIKWNLGSKLLCLYFILCHSFHWIQMLIIFCHVAWKKIGSWQIATADAFGSWVMTRHTYGFCLKRHHILTQKSIIKWLVN